MSGTELGIGTGEGTDEDGAVFTLGIGLDTWYWMLSFI